VSGERGISGVIIDLESPFDTSSVGQCLIDEVIADLSAGNLTD
jgi:hypothetical protein